MRMLDAMSPHRLPRLVLLSGSPRSGTTWTQLLVGSHPDVGTVQETHLFAQYLGAMERRWHFDTGRTEKQRGVGLPSLLSRDEFVDLLREFVDSVLRRAAKRAGGASTLLMKENDTDGRLLPTIVPEASYLHVIRDPRAVVCSIRAAGKTFGRHWAPASVLAASEMWADSVRRLREAGDRVARYRELRYEDLHARGPAELRELFDWLDLEATDELCGDIHRANRLDRLVGERDTKSADRPWRLDREPEGFFRTGRVDSWRRELAEEELDLLEWAVGDLMDELGYERALPRRDSPPPAWRRHELRKRVARIGERLTAPIVARIAGPRP